MHKKWENRLTWNLMSMQKKRIKISMEGIIGSYKNRLQYVLHFLENHPFAAQQLLFIEEGAAAIDICYQSTLQPKETAFFIPAQGLFFNSPKIDLTTLVANEYIHQELKIYAVEKRQSTTSVFLQGTLFSFDLFETLFFHLSRYEEWYCPADGKNIWDLMRTEDQFLFRYQLHQFPVVDHLVYAFFQALGLEPRRTSTTYQLTHDIDEVRKFSSIWKPIRSAGGLWWKGNNWRSQGVLWQAYWASVQGKEQDPFDTFDWMIREGKDWKKTIYFLVGGNTRYDTPYDLNSQRMATILAMCLERGYEVGIHPSYATYEEEQLLRREKEQLAKLIGRSISHSRQHYLHFSWPSTPEILERQGISHDSSMGFNECIGFRCGTGFAYQLYSFREERAFDFLEEPLVVMDSALFAEANHQAAEVQTILADFLIKNSSLTHITFNFHNSRFFDAQLHDIPLTKIYQDLFPQ